MTYEEFIAGAAPCSEAFYAELCEWVENPAPREAFTVYPGGYVLHEANGQFFPHAWWYEPVAKATRAEAEAVLWEWRAEWV